MARNESKLCVCTDELQNAVNYQHCHGQNFIFNDTHKKDLAPCYQTLQLTEELAKFVFILINK